MSDPPIEEGQIVLVQLQSALSIEGYMEGSDGDPAFIHDPSLTTSEWQNSILPAVVLSIAWNKSKRMYKFNAAVLSRWDEGEHPTETPCLPIRPVRDKSHSSVGSVHARWPWSDTFCYVFKRRILFHCLPSQVCFLLRSSAA